MSTNTTPRQGNRVAVVLAAAALITSVGLAGGPAVAKALNADTVDHKHAVGSGASIKARKGKLVATNKRTGLLPNNIIASAPNAARLGGQPASSYQTTAAAAAAADEVVHAGGIPAETALPSAGVTTSGTTFTTTKAGRLLLDFAGSGQLQCPGSSFVHWWIQLDGTPVLSSRMQLGEAVTLSFDYNGFPDIALTGITDDVVPAGAHTISLAGACSSGANGGSASTGNDGLVTATVLGSGVSPTPSARTGSGRTGRTTTSCLSSGACRR